MTCNAYNHRPGCTCGWGGIFHGMGLNTERYYWARSENYTNPNARCPYCAKSVFFYRSPEGGSVYFDNLGPPWPKHPCMDGSNSIKKPEKGIRDTPAHTWKKEGWHPLSLETLGMHKNSDLIIVLTLSNQKQLYAQNNDVNIKVDAPSLWRRVEHTQNQIEISTLSSINANFREIRLFAFEKLEECLDWIQAKQLETDTKALEVQVNTLAAELLKEEQSVELKSKWDQQVIRLRQQLRAQHTFKEVTKHAQESLLALVLKHQRMHEKASQTIALEEVLKGEVAKILEKFPKKTDHLTPLLKRSRIQALRNELSTEASKELMWRVAKNALLALEVEEQRAVLRHALKKMEAPISNAFASSDCNLAPILATASKKAVADGMSMEEGKELMWLSAQEAVDAFKVAQDRKIKIDTLNAHLELISSNLNLGKKGKQHVAAVLKKILSDSEINVEEIRATLTNSASAYLKQRAVAASDKLNKREQDRCSSQAITNKLIERTVQLYPTVSRLKLVSALGNLIDDKSTQKQVQSAIDNALSQILKSQKRRGTSPMSMKQERLGSRTPFNTALGDKLLKVMNAQAEDDPTKYAGSEPV